MIESDSLTIAKIIQRLSKASEYVPEPASIDPGIFIYGAGDLGRLAIEYCESSNIKILGFIDQAREGVMRGKVSDYKIFKPNEVNILDRQTHPIFVAVVTAPFLSISETLAVHQWTKVFPFYSMTSLERDTHPLGNGWIVGNVGVDEIEEVKWVCNNWSDTTSLRHYEAFLAWHINYTELTLESELQNPHQRYAIEPLLSRLGERKNQMVDVGSHEGESVKRLLDAGILFAEYILIEPDSESRKRLRNNIESYLSPLTKVSYKDVALSSHNGSMAFEDGLGYCSQLWSKSNNIKPIATLDSLELMPDFIKIHT
jgi:hypothetical protein